ncbi:hypothetical protein PILCRDRAFT_92347 [Piloderma croceum F 1598]|uniref:Uncharacterized protein n=1 Tax=Piloderma croceum (strain F 1598) TaxID=765440 RepID=A0A0C3ALY9_PILCF|nr:hypothetical protein PILCRDRAFT_92347 [Piloderma croceum F 1598]
MSKEITARELAGFTTGKLTTLANHLLQCDFCLEEVKNKAWAWKGSKSESDDNTGMYVPSPRWSFNSLSDPEVQKLFHNFILEVSVPTCRKLSTTILTCEIGKICAEVKNMSKGINLLKKMVDKWVYLENELELEPIGACGDALRDEWKMRNELLKLKPHALITDCWSHQEVPLMLSNYYKDNPKVAAIVHAVI